MSEEVLDMETKQYTFDLDEYLEHHGIKGQKWGVRNAEWYPIAAWEASQKAAGKAKVAISKAKGALDKTGKKLKRASEVGMAKLSEVRAKSKEKKEQKEEKKSQDAAAEQARVLSRGTISEILKYTNKVDNRVLTDALNNRQILDRKIAEVTPKQLTRTEKLIKATKSISEAAGNVGKTVNDLKGAYDKARPALEALGLVEKKKGFNPLTYGTAEKAAKEVFKRAVEGKIELGDINKYAKAVGDLRTIEKLRDTSSNNDSKSKGSNTDLTKEEKTSIREAVNKANKAAEEGAARVREINKQNEKNEQKKFFDDLHKRDDARREEFSSWKENVLKPSSVSTKTNYDIDSAIASVADRKLSDYSESWYEDLWD